MPVPPELRVVMCHDGEAQIIDILMEHYEATDDAELKAVLVSLIHTSHHIYLMVSDRPCD